MGLNIFVLLANLQFRIVGCRSFCLLGLSTTSFFGMPCEKCQEKLMKLATPDVKVRNQREVNVNKLIQVHKSSKEAS